MYARNAAAPVPSRRGARRVRILASALIGAALLGCQTNRSWSDGCPGVYSGVRYFDSQIGSMPWDGKIFFGIDLPFSALVDTLLLPVSAFADRPRPPQGWVPGCAWADDR